MITFSVAAQGQRQGPPTIASLVAERQQMEERYKQLRTAYDDLVDVVELQRQQIEALRKDVQSLKTADAGQSSKFATKDDLARLEKAMADLNDEWNRKREADRKLILDQLETLKKTAAAKPEVAQQTTTPVTGYEHTIAEGDTFSGIAKAYNETYGLGITHKDIEKANPGVDPHKLVIGKTIIVPDPRN